MEKNLNFSEKNEPVLYYLIGPSYSGKSTWANKYKKELKAEVVSSDAVRDELWGDENDQREPATVFEVVHKRVKEFLCEGENVILDSTGLKAKNRLQFLESIRGFRCKKVAVCFFESFEELMRRQSERERVVPEYVVRNQLLGFQMPCEGEGWDRIYRVSPATDESVMELKVILDKAQNLSHHNPHHKETIGQHCNVASAYAINNFDALVAICAKFHDIGKPFAKVFKNAKGEPSEVAHFYGHECYGAYLIGLHYPNNTWWKVVANVVQWHMAPHIYGEKKLKQLEKRLGPELWDLVMKVHECDKAATIR